MPSKKKKSFVVYEDWARIAVESGDAELALAILAYGIGEETEIGNPVSRALFRQIKEQMNDNAEHYSEVCKKKAENVRKRWMQMGANESVMDTKGIQTDTNVSNVDTKVDMIDDKMIDDISPKGDIGARAREDSVLEKPDISQMFNDPKMAEAMEKWIAVRQSVDTYPYGSIVECLDSAKRAEKKYGTAACLKIIKDATEGAWRKIRWDNLETARSGTPKKQNSFKTFEQNDYDFDELEKQLLEAQSG